MIRKGQKLCNWILAKGYRNEDVHIRLFHMSDEEFDEAMASVPDYEIPDTEEGRRLIRKMAQRIMGDDETASSEPKDDRSG